LRDHPEFQRLRRSLGTPAMATGSASDDATDSP
jgi:hypothetical protein